MKIFLDDERLCPAGYTLFKTAEAVINHLDNYHQAQPGKFVNTVTHLSLDHDLGNNIPTGYAVLVWLEQKVHDDPLFPVPEITIHSANPVGRSNMIRALESIKRIKQASAQSH
jgi:hypothetical protein